MNELPAFLRTLWHQGLELWLDDDQLRFRASKDLMSPENMGHLRDNKPAIISLLKKHPDLFVGFPLSEGQRSIKLMQDLAPESVAYNQLGVLQLNRDCDSDRLKTALHSLSERHPILRTTFDQVEGIPRQRIHDQLKPVFDIEEADNLNEKQILLWGQQKGDVAFDLEHGPLLRAHLLFNQRSEGQTQIILAILAHHIVADYWTMETLIRELSALYNDSSHSLPEQSLHYKEFVTLENQYLNSDKGQRDAQYWRDSLAGHGSPLLELPADKVRPPQQSYRGEEVQFPLDVTLSQHIKNSAKALEVTPYVFVLSAFQLLLHRYSTEKFVVVGSPMACRNRAGSQQMAGHLTNPVPMCMDFEQDPLFSEVVTLNKKRVQEALTHQEYPFQQLLDLIQPERDSSRSPIFQTALSWNQQSLADSSKANQQTVGNGQTIERILLMEQRGALYDLVLTCYDSAENIGATFRYNSDIFEAATIKRFARHFAEILRQTTADANKKISQYRYLTATEADQIYSWNQTERPYPNNHNLAALFEEQVKQHPDNTALVYKDQRLSYQELDKKVNQLANWLRANDIKAGDCIGIAIERSPQYITSVLATLKVGGAYVPIDPDYPDERIIFMLEDTEAPMVICNSADIAQRIGALPITGANPAVLELNEQSAAIGHFTDQSLSYHHEQIGQRAACVLFTSGSTGRPKGVAVPQRGIARLVLNTDYMQVDASDNITQLCNISFDAASWEIWSALLHGATLVLVPKDVLLSASDFSHLLQKEAVTCSLMTTALMNFFASESPSMFGDLRYLLVGGEALDPVKVQLILDSASPQHLVNVYGPTENSTYSSVYDVVTGQARCNSISIGKPVANSTVYILDQYGHQTPIGVPGEIYAGGDGVALGYLKRDDLTAEKFTADPYSNKPGATMYSTGDLGRWLPSGDIEILGRIDDQVKIRGFRIELGEIENAINSLNSVKECYVMARKHPQMGKYLAAYVVATLNSDDIPDNFGLLLKREIKQQLPDYMIPNAFVVMAKLPMTANGKIDKKALPEPDVQTGNDYVGPRNELEETISEIWQQILHIENPSVHDHFFDLGGHSLLATQAASRLQDALQRPVNMRDIFQAPSIAELADHLAEAEQNDNNSSVYPAITRLENPDNTNLSLAQQRIWFVQQLSHSSAAYNMPAAIRFNGHFDLAAMQTAVLKLLQRHDSLRTRFLSADGKASQVIDPVPDHYPLHRQDMSGLSDTEFQAVLDAFANTPFDIENGPLIRFEVLQRGADETYLLINFHHIIGDGWSIEVLLRDLGAYYKGKDRQIPGMSEQLPVQYSDFSEWQRSWAQPEFLEPQINYWRDKLAGANTILQLPTDLPRPPQQSFKGATYTAHIPAHLVKAITELGQRHGASLFMVLMAGYSAVLSRYAKQQDLCIGFPISGRNQPELEELIGLFVNNLAVRCQLDDNPTVAEFIHQVRDNMLEAYSNQDVPFDTLVDALDIERSLAYTPLVQASLVLQTRSLESLLHKYVDKQTQPYELALTSAKYDINLICYETENGIDAVMEYATDLFKTQTISNMLEHFQHVLSAMVASPDKPVGELPLLNNEERQHLLSFNQPPAIPYHTFCLHQRFEQQAALTPDALAVSFETQSITYDALNRQANQLAHTLQMKGACTGSFVGLHFERSIDLIIGMLAIIKTGAAYVPLDPHHPADRLRYILEDCHAPVLVTTASLAEQLAFDGQIVCLDSDHDYISEQSEDNLNLNISADATVYIIYTSGTTGKPKGCLLSHQNVARLFTATDEWFGFDHNDTWTLFHSFAFDFSVWEIWGALLHGGKLVVVPYWLSRSPEQFYQLLQDEQVTVLNQTPSAFSQLIAIDSEQGTTAQQLALRYVIFGGEALDFNALKTWQSRHGVDSPALINMYGITETTVHVTYHKISELDLAQGRSIIGRPIRDLNVYIVDQHGQPTPVGVPGEIWVSGAGVSNGYLERPELTAEKFSHNPLQRELIDAQRPHHETVYHSGDLARYLPNGDIEYLGRIDHQVKIRGHRIELGEIEAQLTLLDDVREAVVIVRDDLSAQPAGDKRLVAYLLPPEGRSDIELSAIRLQLSHNLPDYMLPSAFVVMQSWPLTPNGKVDKTVLPAPEGDVPLTSEYIEPRNETEQTIAAIWCDVLGLEKVGVLDNFFELGGHSLLATQVMARIKEQLHSELELKIIFEYPTIDGLAMQVLENELSGLEGDDMADLLAELLDDDDFDLDD
jgi:amino acid adenylation domain-containing protein